MKFVFSDSHDKTSLLLDSRSDMILVQNLGQTLVLIKKREKIGIFSQPEIYTNKE